MSNNAASIAIHNNAEKHKKNVELRLRDIRRGAANEKREEETAKRTMAAIEAAAKKAYMKDLSEGRPEDVQGPQLPGAGVRQSAAQQQAAAQVDHQRKVQEEASFRASGGGQTTTGINWEWDPAAGYYVDHVSRFFYDSPSQQYFNPGTGQWQTEGPPEPKKRAPPPPPPPRGSTGGAGGSKGLENAPESMRRRTGPCTVCGGLTAGCPACDGLGGQKPAQVGAGTVTAAKPAASARGQTVVAAKGAYELGYGTMHPKYINACKAKAVKVPGVAAAVKRARSPPKKEMSDKEKEEIARREAARARVASRTNSTFGYGS